MIVAIHQPNFIPWLGYFYKLANADTFVLLDNVQFTKNSFINRNRIKTASGPHWLTVPVATSGKYRQTIEEVQTVCDTGWKRKHLNTLAANYGKAKHFDEVFPLLEHHYAAAQAQMPLADFNISIVRSICSYLHLSPTILRSSDLQARGQSTELLVNISRELKADTYLSGAGAVNYQEDDQFISGGICVRYSQFKVTPYTQLWGSFLGGLSIIDALMNCGLSVRDLLDDDRSGGAN